ncbi:MAG: hypothetical protein LBM95_00985 [Lactobacillales bacterium]|jgi:hypothetical protein|nr:hypothetical protein [Lactobacillales bacterium]
MLEDEKFKDWLFRYQYIYKLRRTEKNKRRFLSALLTDISSMREDVQVVEYNWKNKSSLKNVYVGNIHKAKKVICTYYDTPPQSFGSYQLFNREVQKKGTTAFIFATSLLMILFGAVMTWLYLTKTAVVFDLTSLATLLFIFVLIVYFFLLGKVTQGLSNRKTLVRNTSSILTILALIREHKEEEIAFAFVDEGCYGEIGFSLVQEQMRRGSQLFILDSVGADAPLTIMPKEQVTYLFCGKNFENGYLLGKEALDAKKLQMENLRKVAAYFRTTEIEES